LIADITRAMVESSAYKIYVCNVMTQQGETEGFSASDHVKQLVAHSHQKVINACMVNSADVPVHAQGRYKAEASFPVAADVDEINALGYEAVGSDLLSVTDYVRHDSAKLTKALIRLIERKRVIRR